MGGKRKAQTDLKLAKDEGRTSNASGETTTTKDKKAFAAKKRSAVEAINVENYLDSSPNGLSGEKGCVRRSGRLSNFVTPCRGQVVEPVVVLENLVENENKEQPHQAQVSTFPVADMTSVDEKIDYLVKAIDEIKSEVTRLTNEVPKNESGYKSMYISSQKKMESIMEENFRLAMKLEFARGKIDAYEKMKDVSHTTKEVMLPDSGRKKTKENTAGNHNLG